MANRNACITPVAGTPARRVAPKFAGLLFMRLYGRIAQWSGLVERGQGIDANRFISTDRAAALACSRRTTKHEYHQGCDYPLQLVCNFGILGSTLSPYHIPRLTPHPQIEIQRKLPGTSEPQHDGGCCFAGQPLAEVLVLWLTNIET